VRVSVLMVVFSLLGACGGAAPPKSAMEAAQRYRSAQVLYEEGQRAMERGAFEKAQRSFQALRNYHRDDPLSVKAQLALADLLYKQGSLEEARFAYDEFARYHPRHPDLDYVVYRIGLCIYRRAPKFAGRDQGPTERSLAVWAGFDARFPQSEWAEKVREIHAKASERLAAKEYYIAKFYAKRRAWPAVEGRARKLLLTYPSSQRTESALSLLARAFHGTGQVEAAQMTRDRLKNQFPHSRFLLKVDSALKKPPGQPPEEEIFIKPYRIPGMTPAGAGGMGGGGGGGMGGGGQPR